MCSVGEDIEDFSICSGSSTKSSTKKSHSECKKCNEKSVVLLQKKDPFCKSCFFEYCNHKFRSTIGKSKQIKNGESVLLACSGGQKSSALLCMTKETLESSSLKQINFKPGVLFINDAFLAPEIDDVQSKILGVIEVLKNSGFSVLYSSLDMVYRINSKEELYCSAENISLEKIYGCSILRNKLMEGISDLTISAKLDFIKHLRLLLMTEIASLAGYDYLFVGDSATSLAVELLCDIALGRGSQISPDTSFYDTRYKVPVCRPVREFLSKEIALFNHLKKNAFIVLPNLLTKTGTNASIQRLTETFVSNLQENFPATIFTIFRTGGKLLTNNSLNQESCFLCKSKLDNVSSEACSALEALKISEKLSETMPSTLETSDNLKIAINKSSSIEQSSEFLERNDLQFLCHSCSNSFKRVVGKNQFHHLMPITISKAMERSEMKNQIQDFLLDDKEDFS